MARTQTKVSRLAGRLASDQRARVDQAAVAEGHTVMEAFPLDSERWDRFTELLDQPAMDRPRLAELLARDPGWAE